MSVDPSPSVRLPKRVAIATLATLSLALPVASTSETAVRDTPEPEITIDSPSVEWTRRVEWGLARFAAAGLALPPIAISVHLDKLPCAGHTGQFKPGDPAEIHLCWLRSVESKTARLITLHELAHAWAATQLTEDERMAFLRLRGLDAWADPTLPRHQWGAEQAAEVVSWGLMDEPISIVRIEHAEPHELAAALASLAHLTPLWTPAPLLHTTG